MKFSHTYVISFLLLLAFFSIPAPAHHGKDYFIIKSYPSLPGKKWIGLFALDYVRLRAHEESGRGGFTIEPGILYGLSDRWNLEIHSHIEKLTNDVLHYESTGIESRFQITRRKQADDRAFPIDLAAALEFEKSASHEANDLLLAGLIFSHDRPTSNISANLLLRKEFVASSTIKAQYAIAARTEIIHEVGGGIELYGDIGRKLLKQITPGIYIQSHQGFKLKIGMSIGIDRDRMNYALRSSIVLDLS